MRKTFFICGFFLSRNEVSRLKKREREIKILNPVQDNQDMSRDTRKRIRTLKMTLLAKAFFATARSVILDEGRMKFCRFEKRGTERTFSVTEVFSLVEEQVKMSEMPGSSAASYGSFFPRWTSTRRGGLLLSLVFLDEFLPGEGTGGGRRIMLSSWVATPPCAANSPRLNCLPDGVTCRYAAYTGDEFATSICAMKNLGGVARSAKRP